MYDYNSRGISYSAGFFMLIVFAICGIFLSQMINQVFWESMTGNALKVKQASDAILGFLLPAIAVAAMVERRRPLFLLGLSPHVKPAQAGLVVPIIFAALMVSFALAYLNREIPLPVEWKVKAENMEAEYNKNVEAIVSLKSSGDYILALIVMAFLPALCEEVLFRGGLQNFLTRSTGKPWLSIIIVSLIFSLAHFSYYGFLPRFFLSVTLGLIFYYSGRLWLSILAHFLNNALALTVLYAAVQEGKPISDTVKDNDGSWWGILFLPLLIGLFLYFKRVSADTKREYLSKY